MTSETMMVLANTNWMCLQHLAKDVRSTMNSIYEYENKQQLLTLILQLDFCFDYKGTA